MAGKSVTLEENLPLADRLSSTSGITDVDAITLSLTRMSRDGIAAGTAVLGIVIAASVNNLVKTTMAATIGTRRLGLLVGVPMALSLVAGVAVAWVVSIGG